MSFLLSHEVLGDQPAAGTVYVLHGVLGSGQNFRGLVRQLQKQRPDLRFVLVDLRNHGRSTPAPSPHTLSACATDVAFLSEHLMKLGLPKPAALVGHSFGGKVALQVVRDFAWASGQQVFLLDSNPGAVDPDPDHQVLSVIRAVRKVPVPAESRGAVVQSLTGQGLSSGLANWMTTNLRRTPTGYQWVFDLDAIEILLQDYFSADLWPVLEQVDAGPEVHVVVAERSDRFDPAPRERGARLAQSSTRVSFHMIPDAGHWLHVDNPAAVLDLLATHLQKPD